VGRIRREASTRYELNLSNFDLAVEVLDAWRLQRYVRGDAVPAIARLGGH